VESGAMVAAGALVTPNKRVPAGELWGGSPARKLRDLTPQQRATLTLTAKAYAAFAQEILLGEHARDEPEIHSAGERT